MKSLPTGNVKQLGLSAALAHNRNKMLMFVVLPVVSLVWLFAWGLYWIGSHEEKTKTAKKK